MVGEPAIESTEDGNTDSPDYQTFNISLKGRQM